MKRTIKINGKKVRAIELGFPTLIAHLERGNAYAKTWKRSYTSLCVQPLSDYIIAAIYHWWDMHSWYIYRHIEKPLKRRHYRKHPDDLFYTPLTNRQDLRCFYLTNKHRQVLHTEYGEMEEK